MNPLLSYFWPVASLALVAGALFGTLAVRKRRRSLALLGAALTLAWAAAWHGR